MMNQGRETMRILTYHQGRSALSCARLLEQMPTGWLINESLGIPPPECRGRDRGVWASLEGWVFMYSGTMILCVDMMFNNNIMPGNETPGS
jgi:hypothetical protein